MRTLTLSLAIAFAATGCRAPQQVTVTATANPTSIHSGATSAVTGQARTNQGMAAPASGPMTFTASLGAVAPSPVNTDNAGDASSTFTAPVVDRQTVVTVTATFGSASGTANITVNPPVVDCQFPDQLGGQPDPTDIVSIAPVVVELPNGQWRWTYTLTEGAGHAGGVRTVSVSFQKPVTLTSSSGTVTPAAGPNTNFAVANPTAPFTITATADAEPGGTASWDIIDNPPNIRHAPCTTTGPKP